MSILIPAGGDQGSAAKHSANRSQAPSFDGALAVAADQSQGEGVVI
jgi:hypothetical protein